MDCKKIATDFEKRFGKSCSSMFFCGKPLTFFSCPEMTIGCSVSVGGYAAVLPRTDGRITVRFSDSNEIISCNAAELKHNKGNRITDLLIRAEKYGAKIGGADILMHYNSELAYPVCPMIFASLVGFCKSTPEPREIIKHFENYEENLICMSSRRDRLVAWDGQKKEYLPLPDSEFKIILCSIKERVILRGCEAGRGAADAKTALISGDAEKFGALLSRETSAALKNSRARNTCRLFETEEKLKDAIGSGILSDGGIFSVVSNKHVDTFMHNLGCAYEKQYGKRPDFYVTRAEDSGIRVPLPEE